MEKVLPLTLDFFLATSWRHFQGRNNESEFKIVKGPLKYLLMPLLGKNQLA